MLGVGRCAKQATGAESKSETWRDGLGHRWVGGEDVALLTMPGVLRYMDKELASMAGKMKYTVAP